MCLLHFQVLLSVGGVLVGRLKTVQTRGLVVSDGYAGQRGHRARAVPRKTSVRRLSRRLYYECAGAAEVDRDAEFGYQGGVCGERARLGSTVLRLGMRNTARSSSLGGPRGLPLPTGERPLPGANVPRF